MKKVQLRLFTVPVFRGEDRESRGDNELETIKLEKEMNDFLKDIHADNVKKIYVAEGPSEKMGLVAILQDT